jgi:hypothetical protein
VRIRDWSDRAAAGQTVINKSAGRWQEAAGFGTEQLGGILAWPACGQQLGGQPGIDEEELAPLVHELAANREHRLVWPIVGGWPDKLASPLKPVPVTAGQVADIPHPGRQAARVTVVAGVKALGPDPLGGEQGIKFHRRARADPGGAVHAGIAEKAER